MVKMQDSVTSKGKIRYLTAEIRYHEKLKKLKAGQVCGDCGTYCFFNGDPEIEHTGICRKCTASYESIKDIKKIQRLKRRQI